MLSYERAFLFPFLISKVTVNAEGETLLFKAFITKE